MIEMTYQEFAWLYEMCGEGLASGDTTLRLERVCGTLWAVTLDYGEEIDRRPITQAGLLNFLGEDLA